MKSPWPRRKPADDEEPDKPAGPDQPGSADDLERAYRRPAATRRNTGRRNRP